MKHQHDFTLSYVFELLCPRFKTLILSSNDLRLSVFFLQTIRARRCLDLQIADYLDFKQKLSSSNNFLNEADEYGPHSDLEMNNRPTCISVRDEKQVMNHKIWNYLEADTEMIVSTCRF